MDDRKDGKQSTTTSRARETTSNTSSRPPSRAPSVSLQHPQQRIVSSSTRVQTDRSAPEPRLQPYQQRAPRSGRSQGGAPSVRLDMNLDIEIEMEAKIKGTIILSFE